RVDELKRFRALFADPHQLLGVRDLPDPDEPLSDEERELFGIIDGQHTVAEVTTAAPLTEYETHEALHRMMQAQWIEFVGRKDPVRAAAEVSHRPTPRRARDLAREGLAAAVALIVVVVMFAAGHLMARPSPPVSTAVEVFAATQVDD